MPALTGLCFNDGTPFAEAETLQWIASDIRSGNGGEVEAAVDASLGSAVKLAQAGQTLAGLRLLMHHSQTRHGGRERFVARLEMGEFCLRFELLAPLIALLESLVASAGQQTLDRWEPELAARLCGLEWRTVTHKNAKRFIDEKEIILRKSRILGQLANLDIVMAAELSQP
jgi:type VI secretion system protein VasJ